MDDGLVTPIHLVLFMAKRAGYRHAFKIYKTIRSIRIGRKDETLPIYCSPH